jgi:DNA replicative helicase MCM subunit Mcm2 (Cdc46/Mcm family)
LALPPILDDLCRRARKLSSWPAYSQSQREWVTFITFLYQRLSNENPSANSESLEVPYLHLALSKPILAYFLTNSPTAILTIFDEVALNAILVYYPSYERIHSEVHVRIADLLLSSTLRDPRRSNLNNLVRVSGVVTRRSGVFPQLKYIKFDCKKRGAVLGPFYQDASGEVKVSYCANCESKGPFSVNSEQVHSFLSALRYSCSYVCFTDDLSKLSEDDLPRVSRFRACWSAT